MKLSHVLMGTVAIALLALLARPGVAQEEATAGSEATPEEAAPAPLSPEEQKAQQLRALVDEADQLYQQRAKKGNAEASYNKAKAAADIDDKSYDAHWRMARAAFWICDGTENKKTKEKWGKLGWDAAKKGVALNANRIEAQFWGAACLGHYAKGSGIMKAVWDGLAGQYEQWVLKAMKMDKTYAYAGPPRALGQYYAGLPGIAGGDNKKALKLLLESKELEPRLLRTRFYLAQVYLDEGEKEKAREELKYCLEGDPSQPDRVDNMRARAWCEAFNKKLD